VPDAPARPCVHPGCGEYAIEGKNGRCADHAGEVGRWRGSTKQRGYDSDWRRFAAWFKVRHPQCVGTANPPEGWWRWGVDDRGRPRWLLRAGDCGRPTTQVHHLKKIVDFPQLRLVESNCLPQCSECHAVRSARGE